MSWLLVESSYNFIVWSQWILARDMKYFPLYIMEDEVYYQGRSRLITWPSFRVTFTATCRSDYIYRYPVFPNKCGSKIKVKFSCMAEIKF